MTPNESHGVVEVEPGVYGPCRCEWCQAVDRIAALEQALSDQTALVERLREAIGQHEHARWRDNAFASLGSAGVPSCPLCEALVLTPSSAGAERRALEEVADAAARKVAKENRDELFTYISNATRLDAALDHLAAVRRGEG